MKKHFITPLFVAFSFLLCGFSIPPASAGEADASMTFTVTSSFNSDGSGDISVAVALSQGLMAMLKSYPGFDEDTICDSFAESGYDNWEGSEQKTDGAVTCLEENPFADLEAYEDLITGDLSGGSFTRLEIEDGRLYYDLMPNIGGSSVFSEMGQGLGFDIEAYWVLKMPGEVMDSNSDENSGQTLTWNLLEMNSAAHIRAESKTGGGMDPTLIILGIIGLLLCCGLVVVVAAVIVFIVLRKKKAPSAE
jgi:hypothetical protein